MDFNWLVCACVWCSLGSDAGKNCVKANSKKWRMSDGRRWSLVYVSAAPVRLFGTVNRVSVVCACAVDVRIFNKDDAVH